MRTVADAAVVSRERSATVINVGHSKLGGPTAALQAAQVAHANGLGVMVGSVLEMGVANAMGLHLAAAIPQLGYPSYLIGPLKYRDRSLSRSPSSTRTSPSPQGAGLGITVDEGALHRLDARR